MLGVPDLKDPTAGTLSNHGYRSWGWAKMDLDEWGLGLSRLDGVGSGKLTEVPQKRVTYGSFTRREENY